MPASPAAASRIHVIGGGPLTTELKQNAVAPTYVLENLLGQHCATDDPALISEGLETARRILAKHYVNRNQAELGDYQRCCPLRARRASAKTCPRTGSEL